MYAVQLSLLLCFLLLIDHSDGSYFYWNMKRSYLIGDASVSSWCWWYQHKIITMIIIINNILNKFLIINNLHRKQFEHVIRSFELIGTIASKVFMVHVDAQRASYKQVNCCMVANISIWCVWLCVSVVIILPRVHLLVYCSTCAHHRCTSTIQLMWRLIYLCQLIDS